MFLLCSRLVIASLLFHISAPPTDVLLHLIEVEGNDISIKFIVKGGNPPPRVILYAGDVEVHGALQSENQEEKTVTTALTLFPLGWGGGLFVTPYVFFKRPSLKVFFYFFYLLIGVLGYI